MFPTAQPVPQVVYVVNQPPGVVNPNMQAYGGGMGYPVQQQQFQGYPGQQQQQFQGYPGQPGAFNLEAGGYVDAKYIDLEEDPAVRHAFIRKVYFILFIQLLFTTALVIPFVLVESIKTYVQQNSSVYWAAFFLALFGVIAISCFESASRRFPGNYFFLFLATLGYSVMIGVNSSYYDIDEILIALGMTVGIVFFCTLFACQTKFDFTGAGPYLMAALLALFFAGILTIFFFPSRAGFIFLSAAGAILFSFFLIYDTQLIMGGKHKYRLAVDDYVFAALNIYIDIVIIFQCLLGLTGNND